MGRTMGNPGKIAASAIGRMAKTSDELVKVVTDKTGITIFGLIPGATKKDIEVVVEGETRAESISVTVDYLNPFGRQSLRYVYSGPYGSNAIDANTVSAQVKDGVLMVTARYMDSDNLKTKNRKVEVK